MSKFKVCLTRMVEETVAVEVDARDIQSAIIQVHMMMGDGRVNDLEWEEGDTMYDQDIYAVLDAAGEVVWER